MDFREFASRDEASDELCSHLSQAMTSAVDTKGESSIVLSGGSTPKTLLNMLSLRRLPWDKVTVVPSDERVVPVDHPDSNEAMIRGE
ncbi:MAG: 6-phosphogluconolactonase, partial [Pseudomonadota bacterium]